MVTRPELVQVYLDNKQANQIGSDTDGITPEVAEDLGFQPLEVTLAGITPAAIAFSEIQSARRLLVAARKRADEQRAARKGSNNPSRRRES